MFLDMDREFPNFAKMSRSEAIGAPAELEAEAKAIATLGSVFHDSWRSRHRRPDGSYAPQPRATTDQAWMEVHGVREVDIANTSFEDLPADWQAENRAAAGVIVGILKEYNGNVDLNDPAIRAAVGEKIHAAWLSRNKRAWGGELDVPFAELPAEEQEKDLDQIRAAQKLFSGK